MRSTFPRCVQNDAEAVITDIRKAAIVAVAYRYDIKSNLWAQLPNMPSAAVAAPSPAMVVNQLVMIPGGDDGKQLTVSLEKHSGFSRNIQVFDVNTERWSSTFGVDTPRVTVPLVQKKNVWFLCSGEEKPGIRSPEIWQVKLY
jgi:N-acetylneuraminate epimerase